LVEKAESGISLLPMTKLEYSKERGLSFIFMFYYRNKLIKPVCGIVAKRHR
jgi:hypothetical protein